MLRFKSLISRGPPPVQAVNEEPEDVPRAPLVATLKDSLVGPGFFHVRFTPHSKPHEGSFLFAQMPHHDRARFQAALSVRQRAEVHTGNAIVNDEYNHHVHMQFQAREEREQQILAQHEAAKKKRVISQASLMRKIDFACGDTTAWRRNQGRSSMVLASIQLPDLLEPQGKGLKGAAAPDAAGVPHPSHVNWGEEYADDDWLGQHARHQKVMMAQTHSEPVSLNDSSWMAHSFMKGIIGKRPSHNDNALVSQPSTTITTSPSWTDAHEHASQKPTPNPWPRSGSRIRQQGDDSDGETDEEYLRAAPKHSKSWHCDALRSKAEPRNEHEGSHQSLTPEPWTKPRCGKSQPGIALAARRPRAASTLPYTGRDAPSADDDPSNRSAVSDAGTVSGGLKLPGIPRRKVW